MAAQSRYEEPLTEPAEASQPFVPTPSKKPKHKGRIVAAVIGGVAVVAIVAAIVVVTLEQLKSKDADDAQVGYEAVSATQNVNFTGAVGEGPLNPSPDDTCQITATWTYPQVKGRGVGAAKFNKDMAQFVADTLDASK